jgi:hypothetical protein
VKVDDFPADFGLLAGLQRRKEALNKAMQLGACRTSNCVPKPRESRP